MSNILIGKKWDKGAHKQNIDGEVFPINSGGSVTVVKYLNSREVIVKHNDSYGHITTVEAGQLRKGNIKNPYYPSVHGVGFIGVGQYVTRIGRKRTAAYNVWCGVLERCYCPKFHIKQPTYRDCTVHPDWLNFQVFAKWFECHYPSNGWQLDKDLIVEGNKVYSAVTCVFVPHQLNALLNSRGNDRGELQQGVSRATRNGRGYQAQLSVGGKIHYLGTHPTPEIAFEIYKFTKEAYVKRMAEKYRGLIDPRVYKTLMNYEVTV